MGRSGGTTTGAGAGTDNPAVHGTVDPTGATSSAAAFQAAYDAVKTVRPGPGTFLIDAPVFLDHETDATAAPYVLEGDGTTIKLAAAGLPTASSHAPDAAVWGFFVNQKRAYLAAGAVTTTADSTHRATGNGFPLRPRFIVRNCTIDADAALVGFAYGNTAAVRFENCHFKTITYGYSWSGYADGTSAAQCHLTSMAAGGWLIYQATNGDGVDIDSISSSNNGTGIWYAQSCHGGTVRNTIQGGFEFHYCSGITILDPHVESAGVPALNRYITVDQTQIVIENAYTYAGTTAGEYFVYVNDSAADASTASDVTLRNCRPQYFPGLNPDYPRQPDVYVNATNTPFKLRVQGVTAQTVRSGRTEYNPDGILVASAVAGITTAIANARGLLAASAWELRNIAGAWEIGAPSPFAGVVVTRSLSAPSFTTAPSVTSTAKGVLVNGTGYEYVMACRDAAGNYSAKSAVAAIVNADANGCLIWQATIPVTPCVLVVWRRVGGAANDVLTIPDAYVEIPLDGPRTKIFDTGTLCSGRPWVATAVPVPNVVAAANATADGLLFADGTFIGKGALAVLASARIGSAFSTTTAVNTVAEADLARLTIPAGQPKTNDKYVLVAYGDLLNNSGGSVNYTFKLYLGAGVVFTTTAVSVGTGASRRLWAVRFEIDMESTIAQRLMAHLEGFGAVGGTTWNAISTTGLFLGTGTAAQDTSTAKDVALTLTMGTANASTDARCLSAHLSRVAA